MSNERGECLDFWRPYPARLRTRMMLLVKNCMMSIELAEAASKGQLRVMMNFQTHTYQAKGLYVVSRRDMTS